MKRMVGVQVITKEVPVEVYVDHVVEKIVEVPVERVILKEVPVYVDRCVSSICCARF
jgi:hypothetical protein